MRLPIARIVAFLFCAALVLLGMALHAPMHLSSGASPLIARIPPLQIIQWDVADKDKQLDVEFQITKRDAYLFEMLFQYDKKTDKKRLLVIARLGGRRPSGVPQPRVT